MDIWQIDKLALFLLFVVPGFISLKVYDLLVPGPRRDLSSSLVQAVVYSALNFAGLLYPIMLVYSDGFHATPWDILGMYCILFVAPALWAVVWRKLSSSRLLTRHIVHPVQKPWDYVFGRRHSYWVIVHLRDGRRIGGVFDTESFASSSPAEEQIYLEELWHLDPGGAFKSPVDNSAGMIVFGKDMMAVEFFHGRADRRHGNVHREGQT